MAISSIDLSGTDTHKGMSTKMNHTKILMLKTACKILWNLGLIIELTPTQS